MTDQKGKISDKNTILKIILGFLGFITLILVIAIIFFILNPNVQLLVLNDTPINRFIDRSPSAQRISQFAKDALISNYNPTNNIKPEFLKIKYNSNNQTVTQTGILKIRDQQIEIHTIKPVLGNDPGFDIIIIPLKNMPNPISQEGFQVMRDAPLYFQKLPLYIQDWKIYTNYLVQSPTYETSWMEDDIKYYLGEFLINALTPGNPPD